MTQLRYIKDHGVILTPQGVSRLHRVFTENKVYEATPINPGWYPDLYEVFDDLGVSTTVELDNSIYGLWELVKETQGD